ncbi:hypothetical protein BGW39_005618 [Mortierella sp. 14UC]|nr:hypothetical protein BGW39_005618 [Mortierella sp. 14UC]
MKEDLEHINIETLTKIKMWYYNIIGKIGKRLQFRQQVVATAIVYFKRFYTKYVYLLRCVECQDHLITSGTTQFAQRKRLAGLSNSMRSTDPSLVAATCIYLACKIEECPQHIKHIIQEMKHALANLGGFDYDMSKVAEFEFYLLEELEFYLIVYHPYRDLTLIAKDLKLEESNLQTAWFVLNDSYRTDVCLFYAPHMIALAALYIICVVHAEQYNDNNTNNNTGGGSGSTNSTMDDSGILGHSNIHLAQLNSATLSNNNNKPGASQNTPSSSSTEGHGINNRNMVQWFADLNVDIEEIIEITQEILSLYTIWKDYEEEHVPAMMQALKMPSEPNTPQHQMMMQ